MIRKLIIAASILSISACNSPKDHNSSDTSVEKKPKKNEGDLIFDFTKTEIKPEECLPKLKVKEIKTKNIKSIKARAELFNATNENFNTIDLNIKVGHPLQTVLFYPQSVKCEDLRINLVIEKCESNSSESDTDQCPDISIIGAETIDNISINS